MRRLFRAAQHAVAAQQEPPARGRSRFSVSDPTAFGADVVRQCQDILLRVLDYLDAPDNNCTSIYDTLFWPRSDTWCEWQPLDAALEERTIPPDPALADACPNLRALYQEGALEWSEGESNQSSNTCVYASTTTWYFPVFVLVALTYLSLMACM